MTADAHVRVVVLGSPTDLQHRLIKTLSPGRTEIPDDPFSSDEPMLVGDYGRLVMRNGMQLDFYGAPDDAAETLLWNQLAATMFGYIVLVGAADELDTALELQRALTSVRHAPHIIGVCAPTMGETSRIFARISADLGGQVPVTEVDVSNRDSIKKMLVELIKLAMDYTPPADA